MATYEDFVLRFKTQGTENIKEVSGTIKNLKGDIEGLGQVGGPLGNTINGLVSRFGLLGTAAAAAGLALGAIGGRALQLAGELSDISGATGIAAGTLQNFKMSVIEAGGKLDDFAQLATKLNQSVQEAAAGNEKLQDAFRELGVFVTDAGGQVRSTENILRDLTDRFRSGEMTAAQYAAAIDILGKNVNKLELAKLQALSDPVTDDAVRKLDRFNEMLDKIRARLEKEILTFFVPALDQATKYYNYLTEQEKKFAKQQEEAAQRGKKIVTDPRTGIRNEVPLTAKEIAQRDRKAYEDEMARLMAPYRPRYQETQTGGYGAKSKEAIKREESERDKAQRDAERLQKELDQQLKTVTNIGNAYQMNSQNAAQRLQLEMAIGNMTEEQQKAYEGVYEINRRANEAIVRLEEQRRGARGETLQLINDEIAAVEQQRQKEIEVFMANQERVAAKRVEAQEIRNIVALMEQQAEYAREMAEFQAQQDRARLAAYEQVKAIQDYLGLLEQQDQLERSIRNMRTGDQENIRKVFDLEQQRQRVLEAIAKIPDLPYEDRLLKEKEINAAYDARRASIEAVIAADRNSQESFIYGWNDALERWRNNLKSNAEIAAEAFGTLTKGFEDSIVKFVQTGKLSFRSLFNDLIAQAVRASANRLLMSILGGMSGSPVASFFGSLFGGGRAAGGPVNPNTAYVVGEKGPELFMPRTAGNIVPNDALGGGTGQSMTQVTYNIQAVDASSFRALVARDPEFIFNVTEQGRRSLPTRARR